jgi:hypothetical protein
MVHWEASLAKKDRSASSAKNDQRKPSGMPFEFEDLIGAAIAAIVKRPRKRRTKRGIPRSLSRPMNNPQWFPQMLAAALMLLVAGCALFEPKGQIVAQVVSWPLVKQLAAPDAGLPGQNISVQRVQDHHLVAEKVTGPSGILVFKVPAGDYLVQGVGQSERVTVQADQVVRLKLIEH